MRRLTCLCLAIALLSRLHAADGLIDITFNLTPNCDLYGGMGKVVENGTATAKLVAPANMYIKYPEARPFGDPKALVTRKSPLPPKCNDFYQTELFEVRTPVTDTVMHILFLGKLTGCKGGGSGQEPEFKSTVVHLDVDVDSDNDFLNTDKQREPNRGPAEDKIEEEGMGVLIPVNRGQHESGHGSSPLDPQDDCELDGIVANDPDLSVAIVEVRGKDGTLTISQSGAGTVKVYRADDLRTPVTSCRVSRTPTNSGERFLFEGIAPGQVDIEFRFVPDGGQQYALDKIRATVMDCVITDVVPSYFAMSKSWVPIKFKLEGAPSAVTVLSDRDVTFYPDGITEGFTIPLGPGGASFLSKPTNGTAMEYLSVVDETKYDALQTGGKISDKAKYVIRNLNCSIGGKNIHFSASKRSVNTQFGDKSINVVEIDPERTHAFKITDASTSQPAVWRTPTPGYRYIGQNVAGMFVPAATPGPVSPVAVGLDEMSATFGGGSQATNQIIKMLDDRDVIDPYGGLVYETRSVDAQRGGYWVIYRNPVRQAAPFRVTCVGQLTVGNAEIDAFKNGTASYTYISGATGAVWGDVLSAINVTADWATAVEVSVTRAASLIGYAGLVAGTISTYLDLADQAAAAAGTEGGRAEVNAVFGRAKEGVSPAPGAGAGSAIWQVYTAESQTTSRPVQMNGLGGMKEFETDLTYRLYFTATNVACIGTRGSLVNGVKVDARLRVHYGDNSIHFKWQRQLGSPNNRIYGE